MVDGVIAILVPAAMSSWDLAYCRFAIINKQALFASATEDSSEKRVVNTSFSATTFLLSLFRYYEYFLTCGELGPRRNVMTQNKDPAIHNPYRKRKLEYVRIK